MAAYVLVNVDTSNPVEYEEYKAMAQDAVARFGGRYLVRGGRMKVLEGGWTPKRLVVLVFDSFELANEWWESELYAPAKRLRQRLRIAGHHRQPTSWRDNDADRDCDFHFRHKRDLRHRRIG